MTLNTWVARFVVDHGKVTEEGGRIRSFQRRRLDEPDVDLYVLHEPEGGKGEELGAQALDAIGRLFLNDRLSLTGALTRALNDTHATLQDWNRRSVPRDQVGIGIVAALVGGNVVYLAQAGPCLVLMRHNGRLARLDPGEAGAQPLGAAGIEPSVRRMELSEGDLILAASPALLQILDEPTLAEIVSRPTEDALPELYLLTRDLECFALFAITCLEEDADKPAETVEPYMTTSITPGAPLAPGVPDEVWAKPEPSPAAPPPAIRDEPRVQVQSTTWAPPPAFPGPSGNGVATKDGIPSTGLIAPRPVDISRPVVNLRNDRLTGRNEYARTTGTTGKFNFNLNDARLVWIAAGIVIVLIMVMFVPDLVRESRTQTVGELLAAAQTNLNAAAHEEDPAQRRFYLEETRRLAAEALRLEQENGPATDLHGQATGALQAMDAVFDVSPLTPITTLSRQITGDVDVTSLTIDGGVAYMLDSAGGRIISVPANGSAAPSIIFREGETYGGAPAKKPTHMTWEGNDESGRLLILDADRKLFELRPGTQPAPLPLRRTSAWTSVDGLSAYDGNLYILDAAGSQVHRYLPAAQGFDSEPTAILSRHSDLASSVSFAVDGDIFVIYKNGRAGRFSNGEAAPFRLGGIDRPIGAALDIEVVAPAEEVFIADSANKRVVIAGKDGNFRRQLVSNEFTDLRSIAVDASGAQLYLIVGDQLMTAPIVR